MSYIQSAYINALLADATYIDLPMGIIDRKQLENKKGTLAERMTSPLAKFIADNFEFISSKSALDIPLLSSSFDTVELAAVLWQPVHEAKERARQQTGCSVRFDRVHLER